MDETTRNDIRHIFLSPRPSFALMTAALLIGVTLKELKKEIEDGAIVAVSTRMGQRISKEEMMAVAMRVWDQTTIEEALGEQGGVRAAGGDPAGRAACAHSSVSARDAALVREEGCHDGRCGVVAGVGGCRVRAFRGAGGGRAGVRDGDGLAGVGLP